MIISLGRGTTNPKAERRGIAADPSPAALAAALRSLAPAVESWWSGFLWKDDYRTLANFEAAHAIVLDADHYDTHPEPSKRHSPPPAERLAILTSAARDDLPGSVFYATPKGARFAFLLSSPITDAETTRRAISGAGQLVDRALRSIGIGAARDTAGHPIGGYAVDVRAVDVAHLMYTHNAIVKGEARAAQVIDLGRVYDPPDLLEIRPEVPGELEDEEVANALARLPRDGGNDGSGALIHVAATACRLGVASVERWLRVVTKWAVKKGPVWDTAGLTRRFEDAYRRWVDSGCVTGIGSEYRRHWLHKILVEDPRFKGRTAFDEIEQTVLLDDKPLDKDLVTDLEVKIVERYHWKAFPRSALEDSLSLVSKDRTLNRITSYLDGLSWDGEFRIRALPSLLNVREDQREVAETYLRRWFVSAVARARKPGCKVDTVLTLLGRQGIGKSTFFRTLAGPRNFSDTKLDLTSKDAFLQTQGIWIYELSELDAITKKADVAHVRSFLTSTHDKYRPPYERITVSVPRRGVFVGSTNSHEVLQDPEGSRRFWLLECVGPIDTTKTAAWRDQLWAEACVWFDAGEEWWLSSEEEAQRVAVNEAYEPDRLLLEAVDMALRGAGELILVRDLLTRIGIPPDLAPPHVQGAVKSHMVQSGWSPVRVSVEGTRRRAYRRTG